VIWKATGAQTGSVIVDPYGMATIPGIKLTTSVTTIILTPKGS
jgi:hypothetical protein